MKYQVSFNPKKDLKRTRKQKRQFVETAGDKANLDGIAWIR